MKVYWDLHAGSPGADGWMRLCFAMVNREGIAYMGDGTKTMYVPAVKGQRLCALLEGISCVNSAPRNKTLVPGVCSQ